MPIPRPAPSPTLPPAPFRSYLEDVTGLTELFQEVEVGLEDAAWMEDGSEEEAWLSD